MNELPLALAVTAGMLAAVNPCGFALLPAYLALFVSGGPDSGGPDSGPAGRQAGGRLGPLRRAAVATGAMTTGFVVVFGTFGLLVSPLALTVDSWLPRITMVVGLILVGTGGWLLAGRELRVPLPKAGPSGRNPAGSARGMALFGISYAVASLSCTVGPFLALTGTAFRGGSVPGVLTVFLAYAGGMGAVVGVLTLAVALSRQALVARIRRALPYVTRASGALLLLAGFYVTYYGWWELYGGAGDPVVSRATAFQGDVTRWLNDLGAGPVVLALAVLALAAAGGRAAAVVTARRRRPAAGRGGPDRAEGSGGI
ncbi:cytochrome c biogenesis CcdA family protein [Streptomyces sp. ACA25]|uniref:cytochrome c biogenesis CcdA family protein n=1 Tax=Streptomyces sp. ACA25 TaxID=3022596 RepID=UPI002308005D|nr:cytochrome c biogenesis CcdA family protein [Streptomyces sp. ACA25]MDB1086787.1 cytochrome c biogenesis CcdA family protein [Streptomyces sp. ACA25]